MPPAIDGHANRLGVEIDQGDEPGRGGESIVLAVRMASIDQDPFARGIEQRQAREVVVPQDIVERLLGGCQVAHDQVVLQRRHEGRADAEGLFAHALLRVAGQDVGAAGEVERGNRDDRGRSQQENPGLQAQQPHSPILR